MNRLSGWNGFSPEPQQPPAAHRQFQKLDNIFSVPPTDIHAAERGVDVRDAVVADLRLREVELEEKPEPPRQRETKVVEPAHIDKPRRLFVNLTPHEYERLGIVAVKRDATRHQLLREAFEAFLTQASIELGGECACVAGVCKGDCET